MFDLRNYILKILKGSIGKEPDYKIRENALKWLERSVLVQADLEEIDQLIDAQYTVEETIQDVAEEVLQEETEENPTEEE